MYNREATPGHWLVEWTDVIIRNTILGPQIPLPNDTRGVGVAL